MTAWRARLAELRALPGASAGNYASANNAKNAKTLQRGHFGTIGIIGTGINPPDWLDQARTLAEQCASLDRGRHRDIRSDAPERDRAAFLLRAAEDAFAALTGPEIGPVLQVGQADHDDAERAALAAYYAEPEAVTGNTYCFPCGQPVPRGDRAWSPRGWCCPACKSVAEVVR